MEILLYQLQELHQDQLKFHIWLLLEVGVEVEIMEQVLLEQVVEAVVIEKVNVPLIHIQQVLLKLLMVLQYQFKLILFQ